MKCVDGGYDTAAPPRHNQNDRDRHVVLEICAASRKRGDIDGLDRTEVLMALGLHDLAETMRAEVCTTLPGRYPSESGSPGPNYKGFPGGRVSSR